MVEESKTSYEYDKDDDHDRYLRKNEALRRAYSKETKSKDATENLNVFNEEIKTCHHCKKEKLGTSRRITSTGRFEGVTSIYKETIHICNDCSKERSNKNQPVLSKKKISSLLRNAKKGRRI